LRTKSRCPRSKQYLRDSSIVFRNLFIEERKETMMNDRIYKYPLNLTDRPKQTIDLPAGAEVIHVGVQYEVIYVWAIVDVSQRMQPRDFAVLSTGYASFDRSTMKHVGSVIMHQGSLVWHVFERKEPQS
jgi:hypothetical protein